MKHLKERKKRLDEIIQATKKEELFFQYVKVKKETFWKQFENDKMFLNTIYKTIDFLNLSRKDYSFIFFDEILEEYSPEQKEKDIEKLNQLKQNQNEKIQSIVDDIIKRIDYFSTMRERNTFFANLSEEMRKDCE